MRPIADEDRLPLDVEAQPPVRAAAALRAAIRAHHDELEREQRLPKALVEQFHAAGFYRLVRPRELGGLQTDPLTYLRVVELLAEASGSVGWNVCNNNIAQLVSLGLPAEGIQEIYGPGGDVAIAGTAEFNGANRDIRADRIRPLVEWCETYFPGVSTEQATPWAGLRPMTPSMLPRVGRGRRAGVFYNTGHGHLGWTLSAATARLVAEQVAAELRPSRRFVPVPVAA